MRFFCDTLRQFDSCVIFMLKMAKNRGKTAKSVKLPTFKVSKLVSNFHVFLSWKIPEKEDLKSEKQNKHEK